MESILDLISQMDWAAWFIASQMLLIGVIAILKLIPGNQGEKQLEAIANVIGKLIKK